VIFPADLVDWQIVDRSKPSPHGAGSVEFPVLVSVRAEPVATVVMPFVSEPHGDAIVAKRPQLFDQAVIEFLVPFAGEKSDPLDEKPTEDAEPAMGVQEEREIESSDPDQFGRAQAKGL
jgi:hypothetical protein